MMMRRTKRKTMRRNMSMMTMKMAPINQKMKMSLMKNLRNNPNSPNSPPCLKRNDPNSILTRTSAGMMDR
jgi:hypothetical protein